MNVVTPLVVLAFLALASAHEQGELEFCTKATKRTDVAGLYEFRYTYVIPHGQKERMRPLLCTNPPEVGYAEAEVCDSVAPPLVAFTLTDDFIHVIRQDPAGVFSGKVTITALQRCNHKANPKLGKEYNVTVTEMF